MARHRVNPERTPDNTLSMKRTIKEGSARQNSQKAMITNDIVERLAFDGELSEEQLKLLKKQIDRTLNQYDVRSNGQYGDNIQEHNSKLMEEYLAAKTVENRSNTTLYNYGNEIQKLVNFLDKPFEQVDAADIRKYMEYRKNYDGISAVTMNNVRLYLMSFFKYLRTEELISKNPIDKIGPVKKENKVTEVLSDEEAEMIRCACKSERDIAIIDILSGTGMRVSELVGLDRSDVNWDTGEVKVFGKGKKERICFLTGRAKVHLKWYLQQRTDNNEALFVTSKSPYNRITKNGVEFILREISKRSKVPRLRLYPHKYRSTFATNMSNRGADISDIQHLLGHSSSDTTSIYIKNSVEKNREAHKRYIN